MFTSLFYTMGDNPHFFINKKYIIYYSARAGKYIILTP